MNLVKMLSGVKIPAAVMVAGMLGLALTGGVMAAMVAIPSGSDDGTMYGCVKKRANQGQLRIVSHPENCRSNETAIILGGSGGGEQGAQGPEGPQGPGVEPTPTSVVLLRGPVTGLTTGTTGTVTEIFFQVVLDANEPPVDLTPGTTKVRYEDLSQSIISTTMSRFVTSPVQGVTGSPTDSDLFLEPGEIFEIRLLDLDFFLEPDLRANTAFTIDVISEFGSVLSFQATTPGSLPEETVVDLPVSP